MEVAKRRGDWVDEKRGLKRGPFIQVKLYSLYSQPCLRLRSVARLRELWIFFGNVHDLVIQVCLTLLVRHTDFLAVLASKPLERLVGMHPFEDQGVPGLNLAPLRLDNALGDVFGRRKLRHLPLRARASQLDARADPPCRPPLGPGRRSPSPSPCCSCQSSSGSQQVFAVSLQLSAPKSTGQAPSARLAHPVAHPLAARPPRAPIALGHAPSVLITSFGPRPRNPLAIRPSRRIDQELDIGVLSAFAWHSKLAARTQRLYRDYTRQGHRGPRRAFNLGRPTATIQAQWITQR